MDKYKFGNYIYSKRKEINMTQDELGRKLGVTNKAVSKWEVGETLPDIDTTIKLAEILNVSLDELLTQTPTKMEIKTVYVKRKFPFVVIGILSAVILILIMLFPKSNRSNNENLNVSLTPENFLNYYAINSNIESQIEDQQLTIKGNVVKTHDMLDNETIEVNLSYSIHWYYEKNDNQIGVISFLSRTIEVELNNDITNYSLTVYPNDTLDDFQKLSRFEVEYQIINVNGELLYDQKD